MKPKTDWLDVTYSPLDDPEISLRYVLNSIGAECALQTDVKTLYRLGSGTLGIERKTTHTRISISGSFLEQLRDPPGQVDSHDWYGDLLMALSESPHTVTRLDAAYDIFEDAAPILKKLVKKYPRFCKFSRKALRTKTITEIREDGQASGTFYVGHRQKAMVTARVYDKSLERLSKGVFIPNTTRYELTFRKGSGVSLKDAYDPERLFWSQASTLLLKVPSHIEPWFPNCLDSWEYQRPKLADGEILQRRIETSSDLNAILELASELGHLEWAKSLLLRKIDSYSSPTLKFDDTQVQKRASS